MTNQKCSDDISNLDYSLLIEREKEKRKSPTIDLLILIPPFEINPFTLF